MGAMPVVAGRQHLLAVAAVGVGALAATMDKATRAASVRVASRVITVPRTTTLTMPVVSASLSRAAICRLQNKLCGAQASARRGDTGVAMVAAMAAHRLLQPAPVASPTPCVPAST